MRGQMALTQDLILSQPDVPAVTAYLATPSKRCVLLLSIWDTGMLGFVDAVPSEVPQAAQRPAGADEDRRRDRRQLPAGGRLGRCSRGVPDTQPQTSD